MTLRIKPDPTGQFAFKPEDLIESLYDKIDALQEENDKLHEILNDLDYRPDY